MGPQSALTDFLASHNISARQIRQDAEARRRAAQQNGQDGQAEQNGSASTPAAQDPATASGPASSSPSDSAPTTTNEELAQGAKRKKEQAKAIEKIKANKKFKRRKRDSDDEDDVALAIYEERASALPGQMDNCALCRKRFTVTPYSRAGPDGGLLCNPCGKELDKEKFGAEKSKRLRGRAGGRRKMQSNILDGTYRPGAKSLMALCIKTLASNIELAEELGDLAPTVIDKIARELSRRRLLDSKTIDLFLQPSADTLSVYDGAKLREDDLIRVFQMVPGIKNLKIRNAIQFKDAVVEYLLSRHIDLEQLHLHGANLVTETMWRKFLEAKGSSLKSLRVYYTDKHFGDETLSLLPKHCPSLQRLKVQHNQEVTAAGVKEIGNLSGLEHLGLDLQNKVHPDVFVQVLDKIGRGLQTLSLSRVPTADNTVLDAIHAKCRSLQKLRITDSEVMTDEGFVRLFKDWENQGLIFLDLQKCRHIDAREAQEQENPENIGLCSNGFKALMTHSGKTLKHLNLHACRHISRQAFEEVFGSEKRYPLLTNLEVSFCEQVTDFIVGSIFRSCPNLKNLNVFGCMKVRDVKVPRGKILVGVPNAVGMVIDGDA